MDIASILKRQREATAEQKEQFNFADSLTTVKRCAGGHIVLEANFHR
jgi:hypothetical protein